MDIPPPAPPPPQSYMRPPLPPPPPPSMADPNQHPPPDPWYPTQFQYQNQSPSPASAHHPQQQQWAQPPYPHFPTHYYPPPPYAQVNQDWTNANWTHNQNREYQAHNNEEDWAAKARAWAASNSSNDQQSEEQTNYHYANIQHSTLPQSSYQQYPVPHQQEVPSSYSSVTAGPVNGVYTISSTPSNYNYTPIGSGVVYPSIPPPVPPPSQVVPPFSGGAPSAFPSDVSSDRPKKPSVPNWLREEIIKTKAIITSSVPDFSKDDNNRFIEDETRAKSYGKVEHSDGKNTHSSSSTEEDDDDEDDGEAVKTAVINQEIKRVLTEILLKVTDELFDEIATKVLDEVEEPNNKVTVYGQAAPTVKADAKVFIPTKDMEDDNKKLISSSQGDVLGLANYASDDDEGNGIEISAKEIVNNHVNKESMDDYKDSKAKNSEARKRNEKTDDIRKKDRTKDDNRDKPRNENASDSDRYKRHKSNYRHTNDSDDESSDDSRRKRHSRRQKSPSPVRSKRRQISRSPHSKHSQPRHSSYSSLETKRGKRSRSPVPRK